MPCDWMNMFHARPMALFFAALTSYRLQCHDGCEYVRVANML